VKTTATWTGSVLAIDFSPTDFPDAASLWSAPVLSGGSLAATFGEAGIPSFFVEADPGAAVVVLTVQGFCGRRPAQFVVHVDLRGRRADGATAPLTVDVFPRD